MSMYYTKKDLELNFYEEFNREIIYKFSLRNFLVFSLFLICLVFLFHIILSLFLQYKYEQPFSLGFILDENKQKEQKIQITNLEEIKNTEEINQIISEIEKEKNKSSSLEERIILLEKHIINLNNSSGEKNKEKEMK